MVQKQDSPICNIKDTVKTLGNIEQPPDYVYKTLKYGPRNPNLRQFDEKETLCQMDLFLEFCEPNNVDAEIINDLNAHCRNYIKKAKKQKIPRATKMTYDYLKAHNIKAVPYDKGQGFMLMSNEDYQNRIYKIIKASQFSEVKKTRKNERDPLLKEQDRIVGKLKDMEKKGQITERLYKDLKPIGSKSAKIYGLAKVHKPEVPLRPVVAIPGTAYDKIGKFVSHWLDKVEESKIRTSTSEVNNSIKDVVLTEEEMIVSYDVSSLYTNVPLSECIEMAAKKLFQITNECPVDMNTFIELTRLTYSNILIQTENGYIRQQDGLAMGISCAPQLANIWMASMDKKIENNSRIYHRYMDDIIMVIKKIEIESDLERINKIHENLTFTHETEDEKGEILFLDLTLTQRKW